VLRDYSQGAFRMRGIGACPAHLSGHHRRWRVHVHRRRTAAHAGAHARDLPARAQHRADDGARRGGDGCTTSAHRAGRAEFWRRRSCCRRGDGARHQGTAPRGVQTDRERSTRARVLCTGARPRPQHGFPTPRGRAARPQRAGGRGVLAAREQRARREDATAHPLTGVWRGARWPAPPQTAFCSRVQQSAANLFRKPAFGSLLLRLSEKRGGCLAGASGLSC
jgi:hypothetical protein